MAKQGFHLGQKSNEREIVKQQVVGLDVSGTNEQINQVARRLRVLEGRYTNLQRKTQVTDQNMLNSHKKIHIEIKTIKMELEEFRKQIKGLRENMALVVRELKNCARKEDVKMLEKYLSYWQPIKFVTQNQVEKMLEEALQDNLPKDK